MLIPRLRNILSIIESSSSSSSNATSTVKTASSSSFNTTHFAPFHSTIVLSEKSRKNSASNSVRFTCTVKEKRSDAKKALNNLLFHTRGCRDFLQNEWHFGEPDRAIRDRHIKKKSPPGRGKKPRDKKKKKMEVLSLTLRLQSQTSLEKARTVKPILIKLLRARETQYRVLNGEKDLVGQTNLKRSKKWDDESSCDEEPLILESCSQRTGLGLPPNGPLKIADVKNAFRSAALKWHPDKHQGPCQEVAQEKFKLCVDAYKSLCSSLS